jgi:hypothetical protein
MTSGRRRMPVAMHHFEGVAVGNARKDDRPRSARRAPPAHGEPTDFRLRYHADRLIPSASHGRPMRSLASYPRRFASNAATLVSKLRNAAI